MHLPRRHKPAVALGFDLPATVLPRVDQEIE
jgi:hypothetical protein